MRNVKLLLAVILANVSIDDGRASADEVVLRSFDGRSWVTGRIVSIGERAIILDTRFGRMSIVRGSVHCVGQGCPDVVAGADALLAERDSDSLHPRASGVFAARRDARADYEAVQE